MKKLKEDESLIDNSQGFTLVEGVVSSAIFLTCLLWALQFSAHTQRIISGQGTKTQAQSVLMQVLSRIKSQGSSFPSLIGSSSSKLTYVGCFSREGAAKPLTLGAGESAQTIQGFAAMEISAQDQITQVSNINICEAPGVEVHIQPTNNVSEIRATAVLVTTEAESPKGPGTSPSSSSKLLTTKTFSVVTRFSYGI